MAKTTTFSRGRFWDIAIVIAFITIVIIGIIYVTVEPFDGEPPNVLDPKTIIDDFESYIGKNITVEGYFYDEETGDGFGYVSEVPVEEPILQDEFEQRDWLLINHSNIINLTEADHPYYFRGTVREANFSRFSIEVIYLQVQEIEPV